MRWLVHFVKVWLLVVFTILGVVLVIIGLIGLGVTVDRSFGPTALFFYIIALVITLVAGAIAFITYDTR